MLKVNTLLNRKGSDVWTVSPDDSVFNALKLLAERDIGVLPVVESDVLVGIFSERDYARRVILFGRSSKDTQISQVMTQNVVTASPEDTIDECMKFVVEKGFRHLPIVENNMLIGIISSTDLLAEVIRSKEREIGKLQNFIQGSAEVT